MWRAAGYSSSQYGDGYNNGGNFYSGYEEDNLHDSYKGSYGHEARREDRSRSRSNQHTMTHPDGGNHAADNRANFVDCGNNTGSYNNTNCNNSLGGPVNVYGNNNVITNVYGNINKKSTHTETSGRDSRKNRNANDYSRTHKKTRGVYTASYATHPSSSSSKSHRDSRSKRRHHVRTKSTTHWKTGEVDVVVPTEKWVEEPAIGYRDEVHMEMYPRDDSRDGVPTEVWRKHDIPRRDVYERQGGNERHQEDGPVMVMRRVEEPCTVVTKVRGYDTITVPTKTKRMQVNEVADTTEYTHTRSYENQHDRKSRSRHVRHAHHSRHTHHHRRK